MIRLSTVFILFLILVSFIGVEYTMAQDTLDVAEGYETLNLAVEGDTSGTGEPANPNRVYRLKRGGYYLLNGSVENLQSQPLRIVAAKGDGHPPLIIPAANLDGEASRSFLLDGDGTFVGLYISGMSNIGEYAGTNMIRNNADGARMVVDHCFMDHDYQAFFRMNSDNQRLFVTNTTMRNAVQLPEPSNGRFFDTRGNTQDTIFIQNTTLYMASSRILRDGDGVIKNLIFDHVTVHQVAEAFQIARCLNATITNNLFIDIGFEGDQFIPGDPADSLWGDVIDIDSLAAPGIGTEEDRHILISNNNYAYNSLYTDWFDSKDSLRALVWHNVRTERFVATNPNMTSENLINEYVAFSDPPGPDTCFNYAKFRVEVADDLNNPDCRADRNGIGKLDTNPETFGIEDNLHDFSYPTDATSYTYAQGGFPLGDLNWFPDKKSEWEVWVTSVENDPAPVTPNTFVLEQNYPNPFNPTTTIRYHLDAPAKVQMVIYDALGQKVKILIDGESQLIGLHEIKWDGRDDQGRSVASGVYLYQLTSGKNSSAMKMLLVR